MRLLAVAACSAVLVMLAGCGSDTGSDSTVPTPTTMPATSAQATTTAKTATTTSANANATEKQQKAAHRRFIAKVNPICTAYNRELTRAQRQLDAVGKSGNVDVYAPGVRRATRAAERAYRRFNAIEAPAFESQQAATIGRALKAQVTGNRLMLKAAVADDPQQFSVAQSAIAQVQPQLQALMRGFGMKVCGSPA